MNQEEAFNHDEPKYLNLSSNPPYLINNPYHQMREDMNQMKDWGKSRKEREAIIVPVRTVPKIGRNEHCPCGSGKKNKYCCKQF